ncbi:YbbR-like domain-containing protein [Pontibacillus sp. HMF3514]|uniref:CdaR family protein n=1 Tax=Pontibacillus sp. HMF3514 TaxID=2692425 RepID=UPI00131F51C5|nr:CdaR family protein [Pontibacillus sp. HMF3514]QHE50736.1 hypothetical protein GS400_01095 [Pontibacillus sp. HMF3514]
MDKWLKSPWFIRVLSFLLTLLLFASVNLDEGNTRSDSTFFSEGNNELATMNNVPLQVYMDETKYVVKNVPENVTVTVEGPNSVVTKTIRQKNFDVFIDLEDLEAGTHTVPIQASGLANQLSVYIQPENIQITLEERLTETFGVETDFMNRKSIEDGYTIDDPTVTPREVQVTGSKSEVSKVSLVKAIVDVTGKSETFTKKEAPVKVYDEQGNELNVFVEPSSVKVKVPIVSPHKEVPVEFQTQGELQDGLSLKSITANPSSVEVYAPNDVLDKIESLNNISVDLSQVTKDTMLTLDVPMPSKANRVEPKKVEAIVDVENTIEKTVNNVELEVENLQQDQSITFITPEDQTINITVTGTESSLADLSAEDFTAFIDVQDAETGESSVPIEVDGPENLDWQLSNEEAQIRIE